MTSFCFGNKIPTKTAFFAAFTVYRSQWWDNRIVVATVVATVVAEKNSNYACHCRIVGRIPTICLRLHKRAL